MPRFVPYLVQLQLVHALVRRQRAGDVHLQAQPGGTPSRGRDHESFWAANEGEGHKRDKTGTDRTGLRSGRATTTTPPHPPILSRTANLLTQSVQSVGHARTHLVGEEEQRGPCFLDFLVAEQLQQLLLGHAHA